MDTVSPFMEYSDILFTLSGITKLECKNTSYRFLGNVYPYILSL